MVTFSGGRLQGGNLSKTYPRVVLVRMSSSNVRFWKVAKSLICIDILGKVRVFGLSKMAWQTHATLLGALASPASAAVENAGIF